MIFIVTLHVLPYITHFVANYDFFCKNAMLGGLPDLLQYYIRGGGGLGQFITILHGGASDPQIVLRNI